MASVTFAPAVGGDGSTVDDTDNPSTGLRGGGHRTRFVPALAQVVAVAQVVVTKAADAIAAALAAASSAAAAAGSAGVAAGFTATSATSLTVGTGTQTLTVEAGKQFQAGNPIQLIKAGDPAVTMYGDVASYDVATGELVVAVSYTTGAGTSASWKVSICGPRGTIGNTGPAASTAFADTSSTTAALSAGNRYRLTARVTAGTLAPSPGVGGSPIEIETAVDASVNYHTFTPSGAETVKVGGVAGSPWLFDCLPGQIVKLIPIAGGWEQGN